MKNGCFFILTGIFLLSSLSIFAGESWVSSIITSNNWAYFPCKNYLVTDVCWTGKDYSDPGVLPRTVSIGDVIRFIDKKGNSVSFLVRHINYFIFDRDLNTQYGGQKITSKKGDTSCFLYTVKNRVDTVYTKYPSKIVVNQCRISR